MNSLSFQLKTGVWTAGLQDSWVELTARRAFRGLGKGPNYTVKNLLVRHARKVQEIGVFARTRSLWYTRSQSDNVHSDSDILSVLMGSSARGAHISSRSQLLNCQVTLSSRPFGLTPSSKGAEDLGVGLFHIPTLDHSWQRFRTLELLVSVGGKSKEPLGEALKFHGKNHGLLHIPIK